MSPLFIIHLSVFITFVFNNYIRFRIAATKMTPFWRHVVLVKVSSSFNWKRWFLSLQIVVA